MKRKSFDLDKLCLDYLEQYDGRTGPRIHGKSERARSGISLDCLLAERYSPRFASDVAKMVRQGERTEALRTLHNRLMEDLKDGTTSEPVGGDSAPPSQDSGPGTDDVGNGGDGGGGDLAPVPRVAGNSQLESPPEEPEQAATGDPAGENGEDPGEAGGGDDGAGKANGSGGLGTGVISKALGLAD